MLQKNCDIPPRGPMLAQKSRAFAVAAESVAEHHDGRSRLARGQVDANWNLARPFLILDHQILLFGLCLGCEQWRVVESETGRRHMVQQRAFK